MCACEEEEEEEERGGVDSGRGLGFLTMRYSLLSKVRLRRCYI